MNKEGAFFWGFLSAAQSSDKSACNLNLSRRAFIIKSSYLAVASSLCLLPRELLAENWLSREGAEYLRSSHMNGNQLAIVKSVPRFNGEVLDPVMDIYHLGRGYRAYLPILMRFNSPDKSSPFGEGGLNPYIYTCGNPVNFFDPTGHSPFATWSFWGGVALSVVGIVLGIVTLGSGVAAAAGLISAGVSISVSAAIGAGLTIISGITGTTSGALRLSSIIADEYGEHALAQKLNIASMIFGVTALTTGIASSASSVISGISERASTTFQVASGLSFTAGTGLHFFGEFIDDQVVSTIGSMLAIGGAVGLGGGWALNSRIANGMASARFPNNLVNTGPRPHNSSLGLQGNLLRRGW
ncbi:RHS repeat-associated core domain-containing protein [Aeromonas veronii]